MCVPKDERWQVTKHLSKYYAVSLCWIQTIIYAGLTLDLGLKINRRDPAVLRTTVGLSGA